MTAREVAVLLMDALEALEAGDPEEARQEIMLVIESLNVGGCIEGPG